MRRLLAGTLSLVLIGGAANPLMAQTGVSLGRPQAMATDSPPASNVRQTGFTTPQPVFRSQPAEPIPPVQPMPSALWGSNFAVEGKAAPGSNGATLASPDLPSPTPLSSSRPITTPDSSATGGCMDCCPDSCSMDGCGHCLAWLCPANWCNLVHCIPWQQCYASAEYLLWWTRGANSPPLVSTGVLGTPGAAVLFGGEGALTQDSFSGGRFTIGWWLNPERTWSVETTWFFLGQRSVNFATDSAAFPSLVRPFVSLNTGGQAGEIVAAPGGPGGGVAVNSPSHLWGGEINVLHMKLGEGDGFPGRLSLLAGFRFLELQDQLKISEFSDNAGNLRISEDHFGTLNQFAGGQVGLDWTWQHGRWFIDMRGKLALGESYRSVNINGETVNFAPGGAMTSSPGGLLALPSNIGRVKEYRFAVVPETSFNIGYQLTDNLRLYVGYNFLYWGNVFRAGDQVDPVLDQTLIPGTTALVPAGQNRPKPLLRSTGFWAQGMNVGLEYRY